MQNLWLMIVKNLKTFPKECHSKKIAFFLIMNRTNEKPFAISVANLKTIGQPT
jgi:hypothetical protein